MLWIIIDVVNFYICHIFFKFEQYKHVNTVNFVHNEKTRLSIITNCWDVLHFSFLACWVLAFWMTQGIYWASHLHSLSSSRLFRITLQEDLSILTFSWKILLWPKNMVLWYISHGLSELFLVQSEFCVPKTTRVTNVEHYNSNYYETNHELVRIERYIPIVRWLMIISLFLIVLLFTVGDVSTTTQ